METEKSSRGGWRGLSSCELPSSDQLLNRTFCFWLSGSETGKGRVNENGKTDEVARFFMTMTAMVR